MKLSKMRLNSFTSILSLLMLGAGLDPRRKRNGISVSEMDKRGVQPKSFFRADEKKAMDKAQAKRDMRKAKRVAIMERERNDRV